MTDHPLLILAVLSFTIAVSEWLVRRTMLRHLGSALLVIVLTAIWANLGVIPTYSEEVSVYGAIFDNVAPLAIFLLLLQVHLRGVLRAGPAMLSLFALGALGTVVGVVAGMAVVGGSRAFGELHFALGGMFVGTYTGGSINFNAVALEYGVIKDGLLYAGAAAVDNAATTVWMAATVALPRLLTRSHGPSSLTATASVTNDPSSTPTEHADHDRETVSPFDVSLLMGLGAACVWLSRALEHWIDATTGVGIPSIIILTTIALALAQWGPIHRLEGTRVMGWLAVMLFLAVIGALCNLSALRAIGALGQRLALFVSVIVAVHGVIVFGVGRLVGADPAMTAVASQANIGGSTSALALARSLGRADLMLPAILIGSLGNAVGTYLGFLTAAWLR